MISFAHAKKTIQTFNNGFRGYNSSAYHYDNNSALLRQEYE